jgi:hypothetical protein
MKYIYATSTYPIYLALYLKLKGEKIHFLYTRKNYSELFELLNVPSTFIGKPSYWDFILRKKKIKRELHNINELIKNDDLIFTHLQFALWLFVIVSNRIDNAKSYFYNLEPISRNRITLISVLKGFKQFSLSFLLKKNLKFNYRTNTIQSLYYNTFYLSLNEMSFNKNNIETKNVGFTFEELLIETLPHVQIEHKKIEHIYIAGGEISYRHGEIFTPESIENIIEFIEKNNISVKPHPNGFAYPKSNDIISPDIPTELLFNKIERSIISINSTTLIAASNFYKHNSNVKIICLMKLVDYIDKESESEMTKRIKTRGGNNILFPENFSDLKELIYNNR